MVYTAVQLEKQLRKQGDKAIAQHSQRFFRTGKGEYGEGDLFVGVRVPALRKLVKESGDTPLTQIYELLKSKYHEARLLALLMLVNRFNSAEEADRKKIFNRYMRNLRHVNNWDLVDSSASYIVGVYLYDKDRSILYKEAKSKNLWRRRVAIIATHYFIRQEQYTDTLRLAKLLLQDKEDLIHKAVGWMLREVGNRDEQVLHKFLRQHCRRMPRTMLRYAIEKLNQQQRQQYLKGRI